MKQSYLIVPASMLVLLFVLCPSLSGAQQRSNCLASPYPVTVKQADGSALTVVGRGSMSYSWTETLDGYSVVKKQGIYHYATQAGGKLLPSAVQARNVRERKPTEAGFLRQLPKSLQPGQPAITRQGPFPATTARATGAQQVGYPSKGKVKALLLLIRYPDLRHSNTPAEFNNLMNQPGYRGTGSFKDFFALSSFGQLTVDTDVKGWYTAAHDYNYYGWEHGAGRSTELVREAVDAAEQAGVDFSQYDNDGDGVVDGIIVAHAGPGAEEGSQLQYIWSHRFGLSAYGNQVQYDGVWIDDYIINPERRLYSGQMVGIGIFCHEFGHNLNLPDLYDTDDSNGRSAGLGEWCLMASANWLGGEHSPGNMSAWARQELNWIRPTLLQTNGSFSLPPDQVLRIGTAHPNEYYLLENRQKTGLDVALKGSGLAIYHVNTNRSSNADATMKMVDLEEADGFQHLDHNANRGDAGDLYPGSGNNLVFDDASNPNSKTYTDASTHIGISGIHIGETGHAEFRLSFTANAGLAITSFAPAGGPVGAGVVIKGTQLGNLKAVHFNGRPAQEIYSAGPELLYATVPAGATSGPIEVVTQDGKIKSPGEFLVAPLKSVWKGRRPLTQARFQHSMVASGSHLYTFGGLGDNGLLATMEIYHPKSNTWQAGADMPQASRGMAATLSENGLIYAISGYIFSPTANAYHYNPETNKWKTLASIPGGVWEGAAAASVKDKVYVFGGEPFNSSATNAARVYHLASDTWSTAADIPVAVMQHRAITGADGRIYLLGGRSSTTGPPLGLVQIYDPATDTWSAGANMPIPKVQFGAVLSENNLVYVIGGKASYYNSQGPFFHTVEIYDPATDSWASGPDIPAPVGELTAASIGGNLYAMGGTDGAYHTYNFRLILPPVAPAGLSAKARSDTRIDLKWEDRSGNETKFTVERATSPGGPYAGISIRGANKTAYADTGLAPNTTYYYRLSAASAGGASPYGNEASATTFNPETKDADGQAYAANSLVVSPNPMRDRLQVAFQVNQGQQVEVGIYDDRGKLVWQVFQGPAAGGQTYQVGWQTDLPPGIYICRLVTKKKTLYQRIVLRE